MKELLNLSETYKSKNTPDLTRGSGSNDIAQSLAITVFMVFDALGVSCMTRHDS